MSDYFLMIIVLRIYEIYEYTYSIKISAFYCLKWHMGEN